MTHLLDYKTEISHALHSKKLWDNYDESQAEYFKATGTD
jgi:hypothetical protein